MKTNQPTVSIAIPAYNAQANIAKLLLSLLKQKTAKVKVEKILVYDDASQDKTSDIVRSIKSDKISLHIGKQNKGFAYAAQYLLAQSQSDFFILLNDDILIKSENLLENMIEPLLADEKLGLVGGRIIPLVPDTFMGRCVYVSVLAYHTAGSIYKNGNNMLTVDGKILALSRKFYKSLNLNSKWAGNVDVYLYFECLKQGFAYSFAPKAQVHYRLAETMDDFRKQELRAIRTRRLMQEHFGVDVKKEFKVPLRIFLPVLFKIFLKYPLESLVFKLVINRYYRVPSDISFSSWPVAQTTKRL